MFDALCTVTGVGLSMLLHVLCWAADAHNLLLGGSMKERDLHVLSPEYPSLEILRIAAVSC